MSGARRRQIDCDEHGASHPWAVCQHLRDGRRLGYHGIVADPPRSHTDTVLCDDCAKLLLAEDAWTDRFWRSAGFRLYCEQCWRREKRSRGHRQLSRGRLAPESGVAGPAAGGWAVRLLRPWR
jgi:hypothetical protein